MNVVILQPSYIPWRGYFHQIYKSDLFIFYDDVQFDKNGWRNRNRIKTNQGAQWLTIPVYSKGTVSESKPINEVEICWTKPWNKHHWRGIQFAYSKAPFFEQYQPFFEAMFAREPAMLAEFTIDTTIALAREIGITNTRFMRSSEMEGIDGEKTDRLIQILSKVGTDHYISGPSAKDYIEQEKFDRAGISLEYMAYDYPAYEQLYPPYDPQVSIIDLMMMKGPETLEFII